VKNVRSPKYLAYFGFAVLLVVISLLTACSQSAAPSATSAPKTTSAPAPAASSTAAAPAPAPTSAPAAKPGAIELKVVTFMTESTPALAGYKMFVSEINNRAKGDLNIRYIGSVEAVAQAEQGAAVANGVVDMVCTAMGFVPDVTREVDSFMKVSTLFPWDERKAGAYDLIQPILAARKIRLVTRTDWYNPLVIYTKVPIETYKDIPKLKIRCGANALSMIKSIGFIPVVTPSEEAYTAVERGVVDGLMTPPSTFIAQGFQNVTKYIINHPIEEYNQGLLINLNSWNKLPDNLKKLIQDAVIDTEPKMVDHFKAEMTTLTAKTLAAGIKEIKLPPDDAKMFIERAKEGDWARLKELNPQLYDQAKKLFP
jgi:TRAP-type transport system periplasmic protein